MKFLIGELATRTGESVKTLRFWTDRGLLHAARTESGYRQYDPDTVKRVTQIRASQQLGLSIERINALFAQAATVPAPCGEVQATLETRLTEVQAHIAELRRIEHNLKTALLQSKLSPCDIHQGCRFLPSEPWQT